ncbi:MAG TPA: 23S ribosomal RNA methyltransferase Erm [Candidatus Nanoarchaeia archaeon]|nr:23S ribosomal RNA methyltransferase Erm [Candidatus Nanoarchaeia archaeon]
MDNRVRYSQNFLVSKSTVRLLLAKSSITKDDVVVEAGPGRGIITSELVRKAGRVIAVEIDPGLVNYLKSIRAPNLSVVNADFLKFKLPVTPFKFFGNIPFNITSDIVRKLIKSHVVDAYLIIQKEAAKKFSGKPSESLFSLLVKPFFDLHPIHYFTPSDFSPVPKVSTALLRIKRRAKPLITDRDSYSDFLSFVFSQRVSFMLALHRVFTSKQLRRLSVDLNFPLDANPTDLSFNQWLSVFEYYVKAGKKVVGSSYSKLIKQQSHLTKRHRTF